MLSLSRLKPDTEHCITILDFGDCDYERLNDQLDRPSNFKSQNQFITDHDGKMNGELEFISYHMPFLNSAVVLQEGSCSATQTKILACGQLVSRGVRKGIRPSLHT
jgi:hypothetical protein